MSGPWDKFKTASVQKGSGPWDKFQAQVDPVQNIPSEPPRPEAKDERGLLRKGFDYGMRALDYPGGLVRTGAAELADAFAPGDRVTGDDWKSALEGQAPTSAQYLERMGLEEGPSVNLPLLGKTSLRDAEGFALDVVSDPLTLVSKAAKPVAGLLERTGAKTYKSGLKKIDERLIEKGAGPVSDILLKEGKTGTTKKLAKDADKILADKMSKRAAIYEEADKLGAKIDMPRALSGVYEKIQKLRKDPGLTDMADRLENFVSKYASEGPVDLKTASQWKTNFYNALPESAFDSFGKLKGPAKEIEREMARGLQNAIESVAESTKSGLGQGISSLNKDAQSLIGAKKPFAMQARRATTPNAFSTVDFMLGSGGLIHSPGAAIGLLGAKKLGDLSKTTVFRTNVGKGLIDVSKLESLDPVIQRMLVNSIKEDGGGLLRKDDPSYYKAGFGE